MLQGVALVAMTVVVLTAGATFKPHLDQWRAERAAQQVAAQQAGKAIAAALGAFSSVGVILSGEWRRPLTVRQDGESLEEFLEHREIQSELMRR